jgi:hypothetical protein
MHSPESSVSSTRTSELAGMCPGGSRESGDVGQPDACLDSGRVVDGGTPQPMSRRLVHRHADFAPTDQSAGQLH